MQIYINRELIDLTELDGDALLELTHSLIDDKEFASNRHMQDEYDLASNSLEELLSWLVFDRYNKPLSPYQKVMQSLEQEAQQ